MQNELMNLAMRMLMHDEGVKRDVYRCTAGYLTIGIGRNLETKGLSEEEQLRLFGVSGLSSEAVIARLAQLSLAEDEMQFLLKNDIKDCFNSLLVRYPWFAGLGMVPQLAMINLAFNLGMGGLAKFKRALAAMQVGDFKGASEHFAESAWFNQVGNRAKRVCGMLSSGELPTAYSLGMDGMVGL
jgi:lysozyme